MENKQMFNKNPANTQNIHSEHIKEEFYKWFESRGLLAELRAYMRQLMVKALENGKTQLQKKSSTSPKLQAINLLVVDYLFHEDYFYTVSVFASEAHILDSLPQYSRYVTESVKERRWDPDSLPRFSRQETEDILDTLHLPPTRPQLRRAANSYLAGHESLLACIVRTMIPLHGQSVSPESGNVEQFSDEEAPDLSSGTPGTAECCYQLWSQEMQQLLLMAGLRLAHIHRMQHKWAQMIESEREKVRKEAEEEFAVKEAELQQLMEERLREEQLELQERRSRVEVREQSLNTLADQLTAVHEDVTQRLSHLQLQSEQLEERTAQQESARLQLQERSNEFKTQKEHFDKALKSHRENRRQQCNRTAQTDKEGPVGDMRSVTTKEAFAQVVLESEPGVTVSTQTLLPVTAASTQTLDEVVATSTQTVDTEDHELQTSIDQPDPELIAQLEQARAKLSELQEENVELRAHILQQRHRIDELTNRAANLTSQLEESQIAVAVLSGRESAVVATVPTPPPQPSVLIAPTFGFRTPQRQGGGEESLFVPRPQQAAPRPDGRKRPLRFAFSQHPTPTSEESSPTDEVIQNARARIQQLEQESIAIQRNYNDFQTRLFTTDSVMFPPLRSSRVYDPVSRVRRSEIVSSLPASRLSCPRPSLRNSSELFQNRTEYEEGEDSSSEFYESVRIESLASSRRLFNQRNIRQFERWKQFKKKFQRRDTLDHSRRNVRALNSNTSSEDDDCDLRNQRRVRGTNEVQHNVDTRDVNKVKEAQKTPTNGSHQEFAISNTNREIDETSIELITRAKDDPKDGTKQTSITKNDQNQDLLESVVPCATKLYLPGPSSIESKTSVNFERSAKLIESVKILLQAQSIKDSPAATLSNGSLAVESLPRDSDTNSQIDIGKTDSSFVTVQNVNPTKKSEVECLTLNDSTTEHYEMALSPKLKYYNNHLLKNNGDINEYFEKTQNYLLENKVDHCAQNNSPENVGIPLSSTTNVGSEEFLPNLAVTSSDVAEAESGDRATTSQTSGSDILRELNPSKTDSSSSVISAAAFGEDSKNSSDFWD